MKIEISNFLYNDDFDKTSDAGSTGAGEKWNKVFGAAADNIKFPDYFATPVHGAPAQPKDGEQILLGVDLSRESMIRAVSVDAESGSEFNLVVDDQWVTRSQKVGYYGSLDEGRIILDDRVLTGIIV